MRRLSRRLRPLTGNEPTMPERHQSVAPHLALGAVVRCETQPDWGVGQVQSIVDDRVTVTFEEAGKKVFIGEEAADALERCDL